MQEHRHKPCCHNPSSHTFLLPCQCDYPLCRDQCRGCIRECMERISMPYLTEAECRPLLAACKDCNAYAVRPRHHSAQNERNGGRHGRSSGRWRSWRYRQRFGWQRWVFGYCCNCHGGHLMCALVCIRERIAQRSAFGCRREPCDLQRGRRRCCAVLHDGSGRIGIRPQEICAAYGAQQQRPDECPLPHGQCRQIFAPCFAHNIPPKYRKGLPQQPLLS